MTRLTDEAAWAIVNQAASRRAYEHSDAFARRQRRRHNFVRRVVLENNGCWSWSGQVSERNGRKYCLYALRMPGPERTSRMVSAFTWLVNEFFPEFSHLATHRTAPGPGCSDTCINPMHRRDRRVTRSKLTPKQVLELYGLKGSLPARAVAVQFGVSRDHVLSIWRGSSWSSVTGHQKKKTCARSK